MAKTARGAEVHKDSHERLQGTNGPQEERHSEEPFFRLFSEAHIIRLRGSFLRNEK